jgi:trimethylamine--corrinoid protein Co-methyltransferase
MQPSLRPTLQLLHDQLVDAIIDESMDLLARNGVFVENAEAVQLLADAGARAEAPSRRILIPRALVEQSLKTTPDSIKMFDSSGSHSYHVGGWDVHFDPGSAALTLFDHANQMERQAVTRDVIRFCRLTEKLEHFHFQSTGLISSDVPEQVTDCYRLFLGLQHSSKPIVTGLFVVEGFAPMFEMLCAVRGGAAELKNKPLAIFDACPSPPLKWSNLTTQSVINCARAGIPSEFVSMPLTGATSPVTIAGALVQHAAENLAGLVIAQLASQGAPVIFGGSPSSFDMRNGSTPMGAMETMMIDAGYAQIGRRLGLPTHAYMGLSDSKCIDAQAGLESGIGAVLAALAGINVVSGVGMIDFEKCQSLEKLVIDNEICAMAYRLIEGIQQREEPMALSLFAEMQESADFLTHPHTLKWLRLEHKFPKIIDRGNAQQWIESGKPELADRAAKRVDELLAQKDEPFLDARTMNELHRIMAGHARKYGSEQLPVAPPMG